MSMKLVLAATMVATLALPATAQDASDHSMHSMPAAAASKDSPSTKAFLEANTKMHKDMTADMTGDADVDFVRGMIPHHQGAIDMAKIELEYGKDPEIRKLAQDVINAQEGEIAMMEAWLKSKGH